MSKILLTGATGFVGSHLLRRLLKEKYEVIILKRKQSNTYRIRDIYYKCKIYDVTYNKIENNFHNYLFENEKIDAIIHCATFYRKQHELKDIENMIYSNITFPTLLLENAIKHGVKLFINTSTFFQDKYPKLLYSHTKQSFENILHSSENIKKISLKLFSPFGENDKPNNIIPLMIKNTLIGNKFKPNNPDEIIYPVYIENIINHYFYYLNNECNNIKEDITLGGFSIETIRNTIKKIISNKVDSDLNYTLIKGLQKTIKWYKENANI